VVRALAGFKLVPRRRDRVCSESERPWTPGRLCCNAPRGCQWSVPRQLPGGFNRQKLESGSRSGLPVARTGALHAHSPRRSNITRPGGKTLPAREAPVTLPESARIVIERDPSVLVQAGACTGPPARTEGPGYSYPSQSESARPGRFAQPQLTSSLVRV
jgi:hypothetical protein